MARPKPVPPVLPNSFVLALRRHTKVILLLMVAIAAPSHAAQQGISIESFKVVKADPEGVDIELAGAYDGSLGPVWLGTAAKSKDGAVRSGAYAPIMVPVGQTVRFSVRVTRPENIEKPQTDFLMVFAYPASGIKISFTKKFEWRYGWPRIAPKPFSGVTDDYADLGTKQAWWIFHANLDEEDFAALDLLSENWNNPKERDKNGAWKLDGYRLALYCSSCNEKQYRENLQRIARWKAFNPKSAGAAIAEAKYWAAYAWHIRGTIWNEHPDPVALRVFGERMKRAEDALLNSKEFASGNPLWYETYLDIAVDTKRSDAFIEALFEEAIRRHPHFQQLYVNMANNWAPIQGGLADWRKVDALVERAVALTSDLDGQDNYASLYAQIGAQRRIEFDLLDETLASWPRMKASFAELVKRYPSADNLNEFAAFACRAGDKETFLNLNVKIQGHVVDAKWPSNYSRDLCTRRFTQES